MNITRNGKKKQKENIQVFVRIRPLSAAENGGRAFTVVECPSVKEIILHERPNDKYAKKFTFDRVFGPQSTQVDVYNVVVKPLVEEVLAGYNCTVFAYGQTGTGKTFTMQGVSENPCMQWQTDTSAGLIPRTLSHLFDELGVLEVHEYIVRVSYLEIYNEELFDLLSGTDDTTKIRLYEDSTKKGTLIIHGLEEVTVHNKASVYKILEKGTLKRQTAATLINASSSRSHTVFTITVHIKENTVKGEELLKIGKINLVDLAGSENVAKAGSVDKRAREAGSINQSLLTLGRVITALVERAPHIPYRESKLTRLLQESLGGRMKTSIIATISPASINLEETLSTLDYAHRAKNVTNRPEINQKLFKSALLQDYAEEIQRLKKDLMASRERIGVYLAQENYNEMQNVIGTQAKEIEEKVNHMKAVQGLVEKRTQLFDKLKQNQEEQTAVLHEIKSKLETTKNALMSTSTKLKIIEQERDEQEYLIEQHLSTEKALFSQAKTLLHLADVTTTDASKFHDKICRKKRVEEKNFELGQQCNRNIARLVQNIQGDVSSLIDCCKELIEDIQNEINSQTTSRAKEGDETAEYISNIFADSYKARISKLLNHINNSCVKYHDWLDNRGKEVGRITELGYKSLELASSKTAPQLHDLMNQGIQEVLRIFNDDVSKKCDDMMQFGTDAIGTMLNSYSEEHEHLIRDVESIKETIERLMDRERKLAEKEEAFSKIMDNTFNYYNELRLESKKNYSETEKTVDSINEHCNKICDQVKSVYNVNTERDNCFRDRMLSDVESAKNHIGKELEKCSTIAEENVARYHSLTQRLQDDVAKLRDNFKQIENTIEISTDELRTMTEKDKDELTLLVTKMDEFVSEVASEHSNSVKTYQDESSKRSGDLVQQLQTYYVTTENMSGVISDKLDTICDKVNKFFNEELERDVPTGCTPIKKEFKYPRDLHLTSPHERILKRFREARQNCELGKVETVDTLLDNTVVNESPTKS